MPQIFKEMHSPTPEPKDIATEQWMKEIVARKQESIPMDMKNRLGNPKVFSAVAYILRDTKENATIWALSFLSDMIATSNYKETWLDSKGSSYVIPSLIASVNSVIENTSGRSTTIAINALYSFLTAQEIEEDALGRFWLPAFRQIANDTEGDREVLALRLFNSFVSAAHYKGSELDVLWGVILKRAFGPEQETKSALFAAAIRQVISDKEVPPASLERIILGKQGELSSAKEKEHAMLFGYLGSLRQISQFKGEPFEVWQGQGAYMDEKSRVDGLYTDFLWSCACVITISRNKENGIELTGMAHVDPVMSEDAIREFFREPSRHHKTEVHIIGGSVENSHRILDIARTYSNFSTEACICDEELGKDAIAVDKKGIIYYGGKAGFDKLENWKKALEIDSTKRKTDSGIEMLRAK